MSSRAVTHEPQWTPTRLRINAAGDTQPGFVCMHQLENGNGRCGGNVFRVEDSFGVHSCIVDDQSGGGTEFDLGDLAHEVAVSLAGEIDDHDLTAITWEIVRTYGFVRIATIPGGEYYPLVHRFRR